jgi:molybdopterin-containing oxidoreductase family membrane subunit
MATQEKVPGMNQPRAHEHGASNFSLGSITDTVTAPLFGSTPLWWWIGFGFSVALMSVLLFTLGAIAIVGVGLWDVNNPVVWGTAIINLIFWIGIGHAGTFISAFLLLMRQRWRGAFSRFAEAATLFAVATAGLFPIFHVGRPWFAYWLAPYPNTLGLNPQWTSALVWDFVAISTYGLISLVFWYIDLLPDLAAVRDKSEPGSARAYIYGLLAMGWNGESSAWERLHSVSYTLAALATPLVISVHSIIGLDFAISNVPGWHHTVFPPYFVGGAVFSGFAMVILIAIMLRSQYEGMEKLITLNHIDNAAKFVLTTGMIVGYGYLIENFGAWYGGHTGEELLTLRRTLGPYAPVYWAMVFFNVIFIQLLWFKSIRRNLTILAIICVGVLIGMWLERFVIISVSLSYNHMVAMWEQWRPTLWDMLTIFSPFGLFGTLLFLFVRFFPVLPIFELQEIDHEEGWE